MSDPDEGEDAVKDKGEVEESEQDGRIDGTSQRNVESLRALGLTPEVIDRLKRENRCFKCQQVGHWMNRCPKRPLEDDRDETLLQIINSGRQEVRAWTVCYG